MPKQTATAMDVVKTVAVANMSARDFGRVINLVWQGGMCGLLSCYIGRLDAHG